MMPPGFEIWRANDDVLCPQVRSSVGVGVADDVAVELNHRAVVAFVIVAVTLSSSEDVALRYAGAVTFGLRLEIVALRTNTEVVLRKGAEVVLALREVLLMLSIGDDVALMKGAVVVFESAVGSDVTLRNGAVVILGLETNIVRLTQSVGLVLDVKLVIVAVLTQLAVALMLRRDVFRGMELVVVDAFSQGVGEVDVAFNFAIKVPFIGTTTCT